MQKPVTRRALAGGIAWAAPTAIVVTAAPAFAASPSGQLAVRYHSVPTRCPNATRNSGLNTVTINLVNTGSALTLTSDVVIDLTVSAISGAGIYGDGIFDRTDFGTPSTSWGTTTQFSRTSTSVTFRWTIPKGTKVPAASTQNWMDWALSFGAGRTASYTITPTIQSSDRLPDGRSLFQSPVNDSRTQGITGTVCGGAPYFAI